VESIERALLLVGGRSAHASKISEFAAREQRKETYSLAPMITTL
jgi:hypothetical protein